MSDNNPQPDDNTCSSRSEIVFLFDGRDTLLNGDPLGTSNKQRIDPVTGQAIVTDVRLKRYLRDQLEDDGHSIFISNTKQEDGSHPTRTFLAERIADVESADDIGDDFLNGFLERATDIRYFGATTAFQTKDNEIAEAIGDALPDHLTGPVQFSPGRSLNEVRENDGYNSLTSVIASNEGKEGGGYQLDDHRVVYALMAFSGVINEYNAEDTNLSETDVRRLDSLCWRSIKNQANSRSKSGQHPRLYIRVEYERGFHVGDLDRALELGSNSDPDEELTDVYDTSVEILPLVSELMKVHDKIKRIRVAYDDRLELESDGTTIDVSLESFLQGKIGVPVEEIDVYEERGELLTE